eukprot:2544170-Pyramimonas_sp.AAC.1
MLCNLRVPTNVVQSMWCHLCCAFYVVHSIRCNMGCPVYVVQFTWCTARGATHAFQSKVYQLVYGEQPKAICHRRGTL